MIEWIKEKIFGIHSPSKEFSKRVSKNLFREAFIELNDINHKKCYKRRKDEGIASSEKCHGVVGGDINTEYLDYKCIGCQYFEFPKE